MSVSSTGIEVPIRLQGPVVVEFDGRYVWSFTPERDGTRSGSRLLVPWPAVLRPYLRGSTRVTVRAGNDVHDEVEVLFDETEGRVAVVDPSGHPLAVDKVGHLQRTFLASSPVICEEILEGTVRALHDLREGAGVEAYLNYGALLGAVRDGRMIGHDSDTDVCYLSTHNVPVDIITESYRVERTMRDLGWDLLRMSGGDIKLLLPLSDGRNCHIDVFAAFFVGGRFFQLGNRSGWLGREAILPLGTITLEGRSFPAPRDPEAMLSFLYGPGWRTPDPSFRYADPPDGVRRLDGWLRGFRSEMGAWTQIFTGPERDEIPASRSAFSTWVRGRIEPGASIAELGCGTGSDALAFSRDGHPVRAYDFSRAAVRRTRRRLSRRPGAPVVQQLILNELRSVLLTASDLAHAEHPHHLYARHLVGCLDEAARNNLWRLARMSLRRGTALHLELAGGAAQPGDHPLVRRTDLTLLRSELARHGLEIRHEETGPGKDMFGRPDPVVHRLVVVPATSTRSILPLPPGAQGGAGRDRSPSLAARLRRLDQQAQVERQQHRRLAELLDITLGLAVPAAQEGPATSADVRAAYRAGLGG